MKSVTMVVVSAGYCKRTPPAMKQVKAYLKGVRCYKESELSHLTKDNIVTQFRKLIRARKAVIKAEKVSPVKSKSTMKPKTKLRGKKRKSGFTPKRKRLKRVKREPIS